MKEKRLVKFAGGYALTIDKSMMDALNITPESRLIVETVDGAIRVTPVVEKFKPNLELIKERKQENIESLRQFLSSIDILEDNDVPDEKLDLIKKKATEIAYGDPAPLSKYEQGILLENMLDELFGFGPLTPYIKDPEVENPIEMTLDGSFYANGKRLDIRFDSIKHKLDIIARIQKMPQAGSEDIYIEYKVGDARRIRLPKPEYLA